MVLRLSLRAKELCLGLRARKVQRPLPSERPLQIIAVWRASAQAALRPSPLSLAKRERVAE